MQVMISCTQTCLMESTVSRTKKREILQMRGKMVKIELQCQGHHHCSMLSSSCKQIGYSNFKKLLACSHFQCSQSNPKISPCFLNFQYEPTLCWRNLSNTTYCVVYSKVIWKVALPLGPRLTSNPCFIPNLSVVIM
jgi:hypothetical protein